MVAQMTVEDRSSDRFPAGLRILAVDDDLTCLKLLENLLRRCDYQVTTTSQAIKALQLLRENKNEFDLIISDVHMPDMDGFKLLELVGLEMDLPVIMLSANGDTKAVMKGITHGACDYLLKPVRIEELKNIWQHVVRKKIDARDPCSSGIGRKNVLHGVEEFGQSLAASAFSDMDGKLNRKRKDQNEEEDCDYEENADASDDPSMQKKPRVVWSVELHQKFVAAVNQLGIDKAVPKRILELMNVDKLTRENVASHLQKYRLYLKRLSSVASQQANMAVAAAALGGKDHTYFPMSSFNLLGDYCAAVGTTQLHKPTLTSVHAGGPHCRLNGYTNAAMNELPSSGMIQFGGFDPSRNSANDHSKLQRGFYPENQSANALQRLPGSLDVEQLPQLRSSVADSALALVRRYQKCSSVCSDEIRIGSDGFGKLVFRGAINHSLQGTHHTFNGDMDNLSFGVTAMKTDSFDACGGISSQMAGNGRINGSWPHALPLSEFSYSHLNDLPSVGDNFSSITGGNISSEALPVQICHVDTSAGNALGAAACNSAKTSLNLPTFRSLSHNAGQSLNCALKQRSEDCRQLSPPCILVPNGSIDSMFLGQNSDSHDAHTNMGLWSQSMDGGLLQMQNLQIRKPVGSQTKKDECFLDQTKMQGGFDSACTDDLFGDLLGGLDW